MAALKETIAMVFMANGGAIAEVATTAFVLLLFDERRITSLYRNMVKRRLACSKV